MEKCFDEGTLQAFLDSELAAEESQRVARHLAVCDACAMLLAEVEEETAFVFEALDQELNSLVPTQRLWTKINETIETQKRSRGWWERLTSFVSGISLLNPQVIAFGSLLMIVAAASVFIVAKKDSNIDLANVPAVKTETPKAVAITKSGEPDGFVDAGPQRGPVVVVKNNTSPAIRAERATFSAPVQRSPKRQIPAVNEARPALYIEGEETFVNTISRLEKTVNENKDQVLKPSARFSYEKDLAVVDSTISRMKEVVKKNPKNDDARQILFASYRNKIELLNSVNQRGEMIAGLR